MNNDYINFSQFLTTQNKMNKNNLFLHVCCGPCSTSVLKLLNEYFNIFIIFNNPNIDTETEFKKRLINLQKVIKINNYDIKIIDSKYNHNEYLNIVKGLEKEPEGGLRCTECFKLRLNNSFEISNEYIKNHKMTNIKNYLTTTLTVSPHKNYLLINQLGTDISKNYPNIEFLASNFKKNDGYLNSIKLSKLYGLYRQEYCGCEYAKCENFVS